MGHKLLEDSKGNQSSKRLWGSIGMGLYFLASVFLAGYSVYTGNDVGVQAAGLVNGIGVVSAALLGIGVLEGLGQKAE